MRYDSIEEKDNIFIDFGFPPGEAAILGLKSKLLSYLNNLEDESKMLDLENLSQITLTQLMLHCLDNNINFRIEVYDKDKDC